jgi:hypothetical protein
MRFAATSLGERPRLVGLALLGVRVPDQVDDHLSRIDRSI